MSVVYRLNWRVVPKEFIEELRDKYGVEFDYHTNTVGGVIYHNYCTYRAGE